MPLGEKEREHGVGVTLLLIILGASKDAAFMLPETYNSPGTLHQDAQKDYIYIYIYQL
jgi:hypothetical protein